MTLKELYAAAPPPCEAEVLIYIDQPATLYWIDDQPTALVSGYYTAAMEKDGDALILVAKEKVG